MNATESSHSVGNALYRVTSKADHAKEMNARLAAASDRMNQELLALAEEGV